MSLAARLALRAGVLWCLLAAGAGADPQSQSFSTWQMVPRDDAVGQEQRLGAADGERGGERLEERGGGQPEADTPAPATGVNVGEADGSIRKAPEKTGENSADESTESSKSTEFEARFTVQARELTRFGPWENEAQLGELLLLHLAERLYLEADGQPCPMQDLKLLGSRPGDLQVGMNFRCAGSPQTLKITNRAFFDVAPSHIHFARLQFRPGLTEALFTRNQQQLELAVGEDAPPTPPGSPLTVLHAYLILGVEHILIGLDHIVFLLSLMLLSRRLWDVVWIVTGFTIGHSLTLSLAVTRLVTPDIPVVEAMIGFTIALVAAENISARHQAARLLANGGAALLGGFILLTLILGSGPPVVSLAGLALFTFCYLRLGADPAAALRLRPVITTLFGLIHGFGFANVLLELGMPTGRLVPALVGFNVGVEIGQLIIAALLWLPMYLLLRGPEALRGRVLDVGSAALCGLGLYWFAQRGFLGI